MTEDSVFEFLNHWNDRLAGAPSGVLVFLLVVCLAFALRWWQLFPDKFVRPTCTFAGMILFGLLAPYGQEHMRIWLAKSAAIGFIISFVASVTILKFGHRLPLIGGLIAEADETGTKPQE